MKRPILDGYVIAVKLDGHDWMIYPECYFDFSGALAAIQKRYSIDVFRRMEEEDFREQIEIRNYEGCLPFYCHVVTTKDFIGYDGKMAQYEEESDETEIDY